MQRITTFPDWQKQEVIFSGPHFYVGNPLYKTARKECLLNSDYDIIDLEKIIDDTSARTNYKPSIPLQDFRNLIKGFFIGQDKDGNEVYDCWMDYYKVGMRRMTGGGAGERTLTGAILPKYSTHIGGVTTVTFKDNNRLVEYAALSSSLVLDFFIKTLKINDIHANRVNGFPLGVPQKYKSALFVRTLRLNCLTNRYAELWQEVWREDYKKDSWSLEDNRLAPWNELTPIWQHDTPLRNYFERRMALVEIDVISAMALGLNLDELIMMYEIQFPVLQQNENDTWYDIKGNIVFTCSKGLGGVGVDRPIWNTIKDMKVGETYVHAIEKSELYRGQKVTYYAPFERCDRVEDYKRAWKHFEERFKERQP